jgi:WD40 repeat protein
LTADEKSDVFLSYRHQSLSADWVRSALLTALETEGLSVIVDVRDFEPGGVLIDEMERAAQSRVTVAIVDETYADGGFTRFERWVSSELVVVVKAAVPKAEVPAARHIIYLEDSDETSDIVDTVRSLIKRVYVLEAHEDQEWVEGVLTPALETASIVVHHSLEEQGGAIWSEAVEKGIQHADRVVVVLSHAYLRDVHARADTLVAHIEALEHVNKTLPVRREQGLDVPARFAAREIVDASKNELWDVAIARICAAIGVTAAEDSRRPACPYPGMRPFSESDGAVFFGRTREIDAVLTSLERSRFAAVIGPSGSGKSSLVTAGVVPRLRDAQSSTGSTVATEVMRPGDRPTDRLHEAIEKLNSQLDNGNRKLLVIDQFEELFVEGVVEPERFVDELLELTKNETETSVAITVRADFSSELMNCALWRLIAPNRVEIAPLTGDDLRDAIRLPARMQRVVVEAALVERLVAETDGQPGLLPFLQETLRHLWDKLSWRLLTLDAYDGLADRSSTSSGVIDAIRREADRALEAIEVDVRGGEAIVRSILIRLVQFGDGTPNTRRQLPLDELQSAAPTAAAFAAVYDTLCAHRILTPGSRIVVDSRSGSRSELPIVDLSHEAIIRGWPKLQGWIASHRAVEAERRRWLLRAEDWMERGGSLLGGNDLSAAAVWLKEANERGLAPDPPIEQFISRSTMKEHRRTRTKRILLGSGLFVAAALTVTFAVLARSSRSAQRSAEAEANSRVVAQLVAAASSDTSGITLAALLVRAADAITPNGLSTIEMMTTMERQRDVASKIDSTQRNVGFEAHAVIDGNVLVGDGLGTLYLYRPQTSQPTKSADRQHGILTLSPKEGTTIVAVGGGNARADGPTELGYAGGLDLVDIADGALTPHVVPLATDSPVSASAFSGDRLAIGTWDGDVNLIDTQHIERPITTASLKMPSSGYTDKSVCDVDDKDRTVRSIAIDSSARWLAVAANNCVIAVWDLDSPGSPRILLGHTSKVRAIAFIPGSSTLLSTGNDRTIRSWDLTRSSPVPTTLQERADSDRVIAMCIAPDGLSVVTAGRDHQVRRWQRNGSNGTLRGPELFTAHASTIRGVSCQSSTQFSSVGGDGVIRWNTEIPSRTGERLALAGDLPVVGLAVRPGGQADIAVSGRVMIVVHRPGVDQPVRLFAQGTYFGDVAYSADGRFLAAVTSHSPQPASDTTAQDQQPHPDEIELYDAQTLAPALTIRAAGFRSLTAVSIVDDRNLALGTDDGHVLVLNNGIRNDIDLNTKRRVASIAMTPNGILVAGDSGGQLFCGNARQPSTFESILLPRSVNGLDVDVNGTVAVGTDEGLLAVYPHAIGRNADSCSPSLWQGTIMPSDHDKITSVRLAMNGTLVAAANSDGSVEMWDTTKSRLLGTITLPGDAANRIDLDESGRTLAIAGASAVDRYSPDRETLRKQLCSLAGRNFTADELPAFFPEHRFWERARCFA